jgi:hypothetical protein
VRTKRILKRRVTKHCKEGVEVVVNGIFSVASMSCLVDLDRVDEVAKGPVVHN